ncbi:hypothetical protein MPSEU_000169400 [Mayamaea pseudoterrestris]|nr:hypothetical protein MPSEU_000169400 [Mayamaea pseudoterrestris]
MELNDSVFIEFFELAEKSLNELVLDQASAAALDISEIRQRLLSTQLACLEQWINQYNAAQESGDKHVTTSQVQAHLQKLGTREELLPLPVKTVMDKMNEAARLAFARLVLHSECSWEVQSYAARKQRSLKSSGSMSRSDLVEFIGLCNVAVRLPNVQSHLSSGAPLFADLHETLPAPFFPQERLERIQQMFLRAIGYDADFGAAEIKRLLEASSNDEELTRLLANMGATLSAAIQNATMESMKSSLNDHDQGGSTRVVNVEYSEQIIDAASGQVIATSTLTTSNDNLAVNVPSSEHIREDSQKGNAAEQASQWDMAKQASKLHQEILGELLSMGPEEREIKLAQAKHASQLVMQQLQALSPGAERVQFLQGIDMSTQRLLVMEKLWESMLQANGGEPPTIHRQHDVEEY